jgi:F-type H+-transporting ATPase subunit a
MNNFNAFTQNIASPLDQFEIRNLLSIDAPILGNLSISLTNIGLYLTMGGYLVLVLHLLATNNNKVVSNS